jgi:prophage regulatory protein
VHTSDARFRVDLKNNQSLLVWFQPHEDKKVKFIKLRQVIELTSLARATVYKYMNEGRFPKQVSLGESSVAWVEEEVLAWIEEKIAQRDGMKKAS